MGKENASSESRKRIERFAYGKIEFGLMLILGKEKFIPINEIRYFCIFFLVKIIDELL